MPADCFPNSKVRMVWVWKKTRGWPTVVQEGEWGKARAPKLLGNRKLGDRDLWRHGHVLRAREDPGNYAVMWTLEHFWMTEVD